MKLPGPYIKTLIREDVSIAPLVIFRILFGVLMAYSGVRFMLSGWIEKLYIQPDFYFKFLGFEWIQVPQTTWMLYGLHILIVLSALGIALGWKYRWSAGLFFLSFSYSEMMDATNYLNHYYLVILVSFLLIFLPAHRAFSLDVLRDPLIRKNRIPRLYIEVLKWQIGLVYVFAGLAKLNYDWLFHAMPLAVWLPSRADIPILGNLFQEAWVPFLLSWAGAAYDLCIVLLLTHKRWWKVGYVLVIVFHLMTWLLFNIGMFPFIMICFTTIFIPVKYHQMVLSHFRGLIRMVEGTCSRGWYGRGVPYTFGEPGNQVPDTILPRSLYCPYGPGYLASVLIPMSVLAKNCQEMIVKLTNTLALKSVIFTIFITIQILVPLRHIIYPGSVHWNEEGYRWSWRVMLLEKSGTAIFTVVDPRNDRKFEVENSRFLTPYQEKQMAFQPDFILQFAHYLEEFYKEKLDADDLKVTVRSRVSLNGRKSQPLISPETDLTTLSNSWSKKEWVLPYKSGMNKSAGVVSDSSLEDSQKMRNLLPATSYMFSAYFALRFQWCVALVRFACGEDSALHLFWDPGAGHSLHTRLFCKCHAPPLAKLLTNTVSQTLKACATSVVNMNKVISQAPKSKTL